MLCRYDPGTGKLLLICGRKSFWLSTENPRNTSNGSAAENGRRRNRQTVQNDFNLIYVKKNALRIPFLAAYNAVRNFLL